MDLNASPLPEEDEEYYESHLEENVRQQDHIQTSIQTLRREREERRERLKRDHVDDRPMRITRPYELEDGPQFKKAKHNDRNSLPPEVLVISVTDRLTSDEESGKFFSNQNLSRKILVHSKEIFSPSGFGSFDLQGWDDPYVPRTHEGLLKWKYPEMNSIGEDGSELLYLHDRGMKRLLNGSRVVFGDGSDPASFSGKIIECSFDSEENAWVLMRVRTDKSTPNEFNTYRKVMRSIKDNITEEVLLNEINEIICLPMYADRIQYESRAQKKGKPPSMTAGKDRR